MVETDSGAHIETKVVHIRKMAVKAGFITALKQKTDTDVFRR